MPYNALRRDIARLKQQLGDVACPECGGQTLVTMVDDEGRLNRSPAPCPACDSPDRVTIRVVYGAHAHNGEAD